MSWKDNFARAWTQTAKECYLRGCVCQGCPLNEVMETPCRMKMAVFELVRKFGAPPEKIKTNEYYTERKEI